MEQKMLSLSSLTQLTSIVEILHHELSYNKMSFNDIINKIINKYQELDETDVRTSLLNMLRSEKVGFAKDYKLNLL